MRALLRKVSRFNHERGWTEYHDPRSLVLAICSEAGELAHLFRWRTRQLRSIHTRDCAADELADILIFSLSLCDALELDPQTIILEKLRSNARRFPPQKQP